MMTTNGRFQVIDECFENSGGNNYVYVATVYDATIKATRFVMYNDEGSSLATVDYVFQDIDYEDSMMVASYSEEEHEAYDSEGSPIDDGEHAELFEYCWLEFIKRYCKHYKTTRILHTGCLPHALKSKMPAGYEKWLIDNMQMVETDGEKIIVDSRFTEETEKHEPYIYDLMKLKEYMEHELSTMDEGEEERETFYNRKASISFGDKIVILDNCAAVWTALKDAIDYIISQE